ncbi:ESX secretion-associated protein EspG [Saccharothrix saharensis]|uniref:ESX secretion-associated protein EspG n=1 Tax=Saccharothrix saharensis TaxID=571190 RepID=UPI00368D6DEB
MRRVAALSLPAFEILWDDLDAGPVPYPLDLPSPGETFDERRRIRQAVHADLDRRGLARRGRPEAELEDALRLLHRPAARITVLGMPDVHADALLRAVVVARGNYVVRAVQEEGFVLLDVVRGPAEAAVEVLPPARPGPGKPVTVAAKDLNGTPDEPQGFTRAVRRSGNPDVRAVREMLAGPITGTGHFAVDGAEDPITWFDTERGRYASTGSDWITVAPADQGGLVARLSRALARPDR